MRRGVHRPRPAALLAVGLVAVGLLAWRAFDAAGGSPSPALVEVAAGGHTVRVSPQQIAEAERLGVPVSLRAGDDVFLLVPAGRFRMGSPPDEAGREDDEAAHEVRLMQAFYLERAARVAPADVQSPFRLPTEAEWEYACRAGTRSAFGTADGRAPRPASDVNPWGFTGMHTGAWEAVADRYGPYPVWRVNDPPGAPDGDPVVRGGADGAGATRAADRRVVSTLRGVLARRVIPVGYGLGTNGFGPYGRHEITFELVAPGSAAGAAVALGDDHHLRIIRMEDRLGARNVGRLPVWQRLDGEGRAVSARMVPGRYYVFAEHGDPRQPGHRRGEETKFTVDADKRVRVPIPHPDMKRYGESTPQ